jgi:hypothetical protein
MGRWKVRSTVEIEVEAASEEAACQQFDKALYAFDANVEGRVTTMDQEAEQKLGPDRGTPEWEEAKHHFCQEDTARNDGSHWPEYDAQGIYLTRVCDWCYEAKLSQYRPEILTGYTQADVDEPIEADY